MDPAALTRDRLVTTALESAAKVVPEEEQPDLAWPQDPFWRRKIRLAREAQRKAADRKIMDARVELMRLRSRFG